MNYHHHLLCSGISSKKGQKGQSGLVQTGLQGPWPPTPILMMMQIWSCRKMSRWQWWHCSLIQTELQADQLKKWKLYCFLIEKRLQVYNNNNGDNDDDDFNTNVEDNDHDDSDDDSDTAGCSRPAPKECTVHWSMWQKAATVKPVPGLHPWWGGWIDDPPMMRRMRVNKLAKACKMC